MGVLSTGGATLRVRPSSFRTGERRDLLRSRVYLVARIEGDVERGYRSRSTSTGCASSRP